MKVKDLIEMLGGFDPEADVAFGSNYGDYWRTSVAAAVDKIEIAKVVYSEYHQMDKVVDSDDEEDGENVVVPGARSIVLLS